MRYNEQIQAQERYARDLDQLQASRARLLRSCRRLQVAQHEAYRMESAVRQCGRLPTYSTVCRQRRSRHINSTDSNRGPSTIASWGVG